MTLYDEINMLMEKLTTVWGSLAIHCDKNKCLVSDMDAYCRNFSKFRQYEAPTLLEALRKAEEDLENSHDLHPVRPSEDVAPQS